MATEAEEILGIDDREIQEIHIPEWGKTIRIQSLSGSDRDKWEAYVYRLGSQRKPKMELHRVNVRAYMAMLSVVNTNGQKVFAEKDLDALGRKNSKALDRIYEAAMKLNKLSAEDQEDLEKNSGPDPSGNTGSA